MKLKNARIEETMLKVTAILVALPVPAIAQSVVDNMGTLEEVVVTAERRTENVQKTAISVSVRSGDDLRAEGKYSLASILEDVAGMGAFTPPVFGGGTDNVAAALNIRGIPSNIGVGGSTTSVASAAAIYVDGVYEGAGGGYDIDRVEVLRGPQGTLYGRSATSGVVAIHTRDPELGNFGGNVSTEFGNYSMQRHTGAINIPMGDKVALRVSGNYYLRDKGFYAEKDANAGENKDYKIKLLYQPTETLSLLFGAARQDNVIYSGGVNTYLTSPDTYRFEYVSNGQPITASTGENGTRQYWAEINWDLGFGTLTYQPAFRSWETDYLTRVRTSTQSFNQVISTPKDEFTTHELRLASGQESKLKWLVGTLIYDNTLHNINDFTNQPANSARRKIDTLRDTKAWGTFVEATYPITDSLRVTGGLRYDETKVAVSQDFTINQTSATPANFNTTAAGFPEVLVTRNLSGSAGERKFTETTYKARIEYDLTPQNMIYAVTSSAASPGDVTLTADTNNQPIVREVVSQTLTAYEIGSKNRFLDNRLQVNGSVYYNDYGGFQTLQVNVNPVPGPTQVFETLTAPVKVVGAELETEFQATPDDNIGLNLAYTHSYFADRTAPTSFGTTFGTYFARSNVPKTIPVTAQLSYDHAFHPFGNSRLNFGGDVAYTSAYDIVNITEVQASTPALAVLIPYVRADEEYIFNLRGSWSFVDGKYSLAGWVRNVGDNRYKTTANISMVTAPSGLNTINTALSPPRTWGISVSAKF